MHCPVILGICGPQVVVLIRYFVGHFLHWLIFSRSIFDTYDSDEFQLTHTAHSSSVVSTYCSSKLYVYLGMLSREENTN